MYKILMLLVHRIYFYVLFEICNWHITSIVHERQREKVDSPHIQMYIYVAAKKDPIDS